MELCIIPVYTDTGLYFSAVIYVLNFNSFLQAPASLCFFGLPSFAVPWSRLHTTATEKSTKLAPRWKCSWALMSLAPQVKWRMTNLPSWFFLPTCSAPTLPPCFFCSPVHDIYQNISRIDELMLFQLPLILVDTCYKKIGSNEECLHKTRYNWNSVIMNLFL